mgnify:CR=1 FL=1
MLHCTLDGFGGHRSRFDDIRLVHELLEELPGRLGLQPAMPPMLLPYYNGVEPDDCGISGFVFLAGGHLTPCAVLVAKFWRPASGRQQQHLALESRAEQRRVKQARPDL